MNKKIIPSTKESIPVIGMGTWISFNVGKNIRLRNQRTQVLKKFFEYGGGMIDSSPMYGSSEEVLGYALKKIGYPKGLFSATKIWTPSTEKGKEQFKDSLKLWGLKKLDLEQVHNLVNYEEHLETLQKLKAEKRIRYIGVTTSHGRRHSELKKVLKSKNIDFVQLTYNMQNTDAEPLIELAQKNNIAVIANRPYAGGGLIKNIQNKPLPKWSKDIDCTTWADFLLKYIVSDPGVTCAIPATTQVEHMQENMQAGIGKLPTPKQRQQMMSYFKSL
ncbi:MAG: aldo/keto reductase [Bdellovibrionales bacterium]|nr:aldo/keto reductase [Bdellovibrionales bacterium]